MFGIKPRKIPHEEAPREIWKRINTPTIESAKTVKIGERVYPLIESSKNVKIVTGEGFHYDEKRQGILRGEEFLPTVENLTQEYKKLMIMCWDKGGLQGLRDNFVNSYSNEEREKIREAIEKKNLMIYLAPGRPKWHFAVIDGKYLYAQKKHKEGAPSSKKPWLYCENDFFEEPLKHSEIFDSWAEKCTLVTPDDIII